jgi:hypothetical protein
MTDENMYQGPNSNVIEPLSRENIVLYRKQMIPMWIKVFGWLFIVFGGLVAIIGLFSAITGTEGSYSLYGIEHEGPVYSPISLLIVALFVAHAVCAFGLLFAQPWGPKSCLFLGYISVAICLYTMLMGEGVEIRLELIVLIPYLIKLHKIKATWFGESDSMQESEAL